MGGKVCMHTENLYWHPQKGNLDMSPPTEQEIGTLKGHSVVDRAGMNVILENNILSTMK